MQTASEPSLQFTMDDDEPGVQATDEGAQQAEFAPHETTDGHAFALQQTASDPGFAGRGRSGRSHGRGRAPNRGRGISKRPEKRWNHDAEARDEARKADRGGPIASRPPASNEPKRELWRILNGFQNSDNYGVYVSEHLRDPRRHYIDDYYDEVADHCVGIRDLGSSLGRLGDPVSGECRQGFTQLAGTLRRLAGRIEAALPP
jgi:hypothetical protein